MPISIEADSTLAQGYIKVNGTTAATVTSTGLTTASLQNAAVTPAKLSQPYTLATAQASTSGTNIDFTGIPSWAKRITVMFSGVSTSGTSNILIQLGNAGGFETSGYLCSSAVMRNASTSVTSNYTAGFGIQSGDQAATTVVHGAFTISNVSSNTWVASGAFATTDVAKAGSLGGNKTLSDTLTQIRITTVNGTDTFDAGTINIAYEG